jgi:hypothetical protein
MQGQGRHNISHMPCIRGKLLPVQCNRGKGRGGEGKGANRVSVHGSIVERSPTIDV